MTHSTHYFWSPTAFLLLPCCCLVGKQCVKVELPLPLTAAPPFVPSACAFLFHMMDKPVSERFNDESKEMDLIGADDILAVSPVNSADNAAIDAQAAERRPPKSPLPQTEDADGELTAFRTKFNPKNEDAFSSSSEELSESGDELGKPRIFSQQSGGGNPFSQSEFDRALMTGDGVPNTGSASFDVKEGSEFLAQAEHTLIHEVLSADSTDISPDRPYSRNTTRQRARRSPRSTTSPSQNGTTVTTAAAVSASLPPPPPPPPPPPALPLRHTASIASRTSDGSGLGLPSTATVSTAASTRRHDEEDLSTGVLPDVLMTMRQKIESLTLFDSDMMRLAQGGDFPDDDQTRETLKRSSQQSVSAAVLVSLAHKRYERRRLAAMEIEKVVRSLVQQKELERVRAILLLLSDDYVRSTSEDARKGGVVALAACAIGLKKGSEADRDVMECRDLILASVVHACQDHSQRVRYYATESLFNVLKAIPALAVQHFFILFEILRSLYADVDVDVRSGAQLLDKRLKEWIVGAINSGSFTADACVPIFARFVYMRNKATKRLTLSWLQELNEKLIGAPVLEFLHLFLSGIFAMVADPNITIRQSALAFLQSVLPKLLMQNEAFEDDSASTKVDFDKILQSLVTTLEHADPFVRKVAMYWMCRIVSAHMTQPSTKSVGAKEPRLSVASISVRNSLPHVLPGILLSIGDTFHNRASTKDSFLPEQTTRSLAEQTNACLQDAVRRDGSAYVTHLDGFIMALREELDTPGGVNARNPPAIERTPYRIDVTPDGNGIESPGWFRASEDQKNEESTMLSRLCALHWIIVLYESVVPDVLKAEYAREFITPIIHQLVDNPPEDIIFKSLEVLAIITVPVQGESIPRETSTSSLLALASLEESENLDSEFPMTDENARFALDIMGSSRRQFKSRDRQVFSVLIRLHAHNHQLLGDLSRVIQFMCQLQPPEFVFVAFAVELDRFVRKQADPSKDTVTNGSTLDSQPKGNEYSSNLEFVSAFVQQMNHVLFFTAETEPLREKIRDCIGQAKGISEKSRQRKRLFHILLHSFSHNLASTVSLCLLGGAFRTASLFLRHIDPLDINLVFLVELDKLVEMLERPLFRHLHLRMLESDADPTAEGSGTMLFQTLKSLLMLVPQSTCYRILRDRLSTVSRFRQSALAVVPMQEPIEIPEETEAFVERVMSVRKLHCTARWNKIRSESLETKQREKMEHVDSEKGRREWLGYSSKEEENASRQKYLEESRAGVVIEEIKDGYHDLESMDRTNVKDYLPNKDDDGAENSNMTSEEKEESGSEQQWKQFWAKESAAGSF